MAFDDRDDPFDDRNGPFDEFFDEIERMMESMTGVGAAGPDAGGDAGFGSDTHVDVYEEGDTVRVVADLPGVEKESLDLQCDGEVLTVRAATDGRETTERIRLPTRVDEHSAGATFKNGVLQVTFDRADDSAEIDLE